MGWNYLSIPKLQRLHRWSLGMDKKFHPMHYNGCDYLSMLGLKLNHVIKRGHWLSVKLAMLGLKLNHVCKRAPDNYLPLEGCSYYLKSNRFMCTWFHPSLYRPSGAYWIDSLAIHFDVKDIYLDSYMPYFNAHSPISCIKTSESGSTYVVHACYPPLHYK